LKFIIKSVLVTILTNNIHNVIPRGSLRKTAHKPAARHEFFIYFSDVYCNTII